MPIILGDIISAIVSTADIIASNAVKYYRYCQGPRLIMLRIVTALASLEHESQMRIWVYGGSMFVACY